LDIVHSLRKPAGVIPGRFAILALGNLTNGYQGGPEARFGQTWRPSPYPTAPAIRVNTGLT